MHSASDTRQLEQQHASLALPRAGNHASKLANLLVSATHSGWPAAAAVGASCCAGGVHELTRLVSHAARL